MEAAAGAGISEGCVYNYEANVCVAIMDLKPQYLCWLSGPIPAVLRLVTVGRCEEAVPGLERQSGRQRGNKVAEKTNISRLRNRYRLSSRYK